MAPECPSLPFTSSCLPVLSPPPNHIFLSVAENKPLQIASIQCNTVVYASANLINLGRRGPEGTHEKYPWTHIACMY